MDLKKHAHPDKLELYGFWWTEARLVLAGIALLMGGIPAVFLLLPGMYGITWPFLKLAWLISGVVSAYLAYRWYTGGQKVFGGKDKKDLTAFAVAVVTGINLGLAGLLGANIGMRILGGRLIFFLAGLIYLAAAAYLFKRYNESGKKLF